MNTPKRRPKVQPEHRAADPDRALERTFEDGTALDRLPDHDRRPYTAPKQSIEEPVSVVAQAPSGELVEITTHPGSLPVVDNSKPIIPVADPRQP